MFNKHLADLIHNTIKPLDLPYLREATDDTIKEGIDRELFQAFLTIRDDLMHSEGTVYTKLEWLDPITPIEISELIVATSDTYIDHAVDFFGVREAIELITPTQYIAHATASAIRAIVITPQFFWWGIRAKMLAGFDVELSKPFGDAANGLAYFVRDGNYYKPMLLDLCLRLGHKDDGRNFGEIVEQEFDSLPLERRIEIIDPSKRFLHGTVRSYHQPGECEPVDELGDHIRKGLEETLSAKVEIAKEFAQTKVKAVVDEQLKTVSADVLLAAYLVLFAVDERFAEYFKQVVQYEARNLAKASPQE